ncbi:25598_t:CDS:2, partial [Racocetra persica]
GIESANILVAQIKKYDAYEPPYNFTFMEEIESPQTWWNGCKLENHNLQKLALHLLAITPHSASCERIFSVLSWITQKRRSRLTVEKVSNIAKLHTYYLTNAQNELNYVANNLSELEFEQIMENYSNLVEYDDDMFTSEEFDEDYISDEDNLDEIRQFDCENLEIGEIIDFNTFSEEKVNEVNVNSSIETEEEADYDINEVINAAI